MTIDHDEGTAPLDGNAVAGLPSAPPASSGGMGVAVVGGWSALYNNPSCRPDNHRKIMSKVIYLVLGAYAGIIATADANSASAEPAGDVFRGKTITVYC